MIIQNIKQRLQSLDIKQKSITIFVLGILSAFSMQPLGFVAILLLTIPFTIFISETAKSKKQAFLFGILFGSGYFITSLYWITNALFVDIKAWFWVIPFSFIIGPALLSIYTGFAFLFTYMTKVKNVSYVLLLSLFWILSEFMRGHLFTGFPWNLFGYAWDDYPYVMQSLSLFGIYGLTYLTILWASIPAIFILENKYKPLSILLILSFLSVNLYGMNRIYNNNSTMLEGTKVRLIQPNIKQTDKWLAEKRWENFNIYLDLANSEDNKDITHIIWPESAITFSLNQYPNALKRIADATPENGLTITGALRVEYGENDKVMPYNSLIAINNKAQIIETSNKFHLVPFGEYIPYKDYLPLKPLANMTDFIKGIGPKTIDIQGFSSFSPLICYEIIFPANVTDKNNSPDWIVNITNDAWYKNSAGPYQHLGISKARAIETGISVVRVAGTGISAVISPYGEIINKIDLNQKAHIDSDIPKKINSTIYATYSNIPLIILILLNLLLIILFRKGNIIKKNSL